MTERFLEGNDLEEEMNKDSSYHFGGVEFSELNQKEIQNKLQTKLPKEYITFRQGPGGQKVPYIESWRAIDIANTIFGFNGWSSSVINLSLDYIEEDKNGKVNCGVSAVVRIQLKDGTYHEDVGYGFSENSKGKGAGLEKAKKEAVSDALKRTLRLFGNGLGNSVYDKEYSKATKVIPNTNQPSILQPITPTSNQHQNLQQQPQWIPNAHQLVNTPQNFVNSNQSSYQSYGNSGQQPQHVSWEKQKP